VFVQNDIHQDNIVYSFSVLNLYFQYLHLDEQWLLHPHYFCSTRKKGLSPESLFLCVLLDDCEIYLVLRESHSRKYGMYVSFEC
jgi:hypothetical protein